MRPKALSVKLAIAVVLATGATSFAQARSHAPLVTQAPAGKWAIVLHGGACG